MIKLTWNRFKYKETPMQKDIQIPFDAEAELYTLGAAFNHEEDREIATVSLSEAHFCDLDNRAIFAAIVRIEQRKLNFSTSLLTEVLRENGHNPDLIRDKISTISMLSHGVDVRYYTEKLKNVYIRRALLLEGQQLMRRAIDLKEEPSDLLNKLAETVHDIDTHGNPIKIWTLRDAQRDYYNGANWKETFLDRVDKKSRGESWLSGISTGYPSIDLITGGFEQARTTIIGTNTGVGKSEIIFQFIAKLIRLEVPCLLFSLEMSAQECHDRLKGIFSGIFHAKVKKLQVNEEQVERLLAHYDMWENATPYLYIVDKPGLNTNTIRTITSRMVRKHGVQIFFVDHLAKVSATEGNNAYEKTTQVSKDLANLSKELKTHGVISAQVSRKNTDGMKMRPPKASDLRDSGHIEQDADNIFMIHRERDEQNNFVDDRIMFNIEKTRGTGDPGRVTMEMDIDSQEMRELESVENLINKVNKQHNETSKEWKLYEPK